MLYPAELRALETGMTSQFDGRYHAVERDPVQDRIDHRLGVLRLDFATGEAVMPCG